MAGCRGEASTTAVPRASLLLLACTSEDNLCLKLYAAPTWAGISWPRPGTRLVLLRFLSTSFSPLSRRLSRALQLAVLVNIIIIIIIIITIIIIPGGQSEPALVARAGGRVRLASTGEVAAGNDQILRVCELKFNICLNKKVNDIMQPGENLSSLNYCNQGY